MRDIDEPSVLEVCIDELVKWKMALLEESEHSQTESTALLGYTLIHIEGLQKQAGKLEVSIEAQLRTIQEQSDTLMNREKLVDELKDTIEQLRTANETIVAPGEPEIVGSVMAEMAGIEVTEVADALEGYGLNVVRMSSADNHALVGSAFIRVGFALRSQKSWSAAMNWLKGVE